MEGNNAMIKAGDEIQTDKVWVDPATGTRYPVYRKMVDTGALPNATGKNVAHGVTGMAVTKYMKASLWATDGSTKGRVIAGDPVVEVTATNIVITATANLSAYTASTVLLEFVKTAHTV